VRHAAALLLPVVSHAHPLARARPRSLAVLERRYPVLLRRFCLRPGVRAIRQPRATVSLTFARTATGSGGRGALRGGDGVIREIQFLRPLACGILSERRSYRPYGLAGGGDAACGRNRILTAVRALCELASAAGARGGR
jgi:5-oxoprolinase (ATP-hydrolysing)